MTENGKETEQEEGYQTLTLKADKVFLLCIDAL